MERLPKDQIASCDWCDEERQATHRTAIYPHSPIYAYACQRHLPQLELYEHARPQRRKFQ